MNHSGIEHKYKNMNKLKFKKPNKKVSKTALKKRADKLFSLLVRSIGYCQAEGRTGIKCGGPLQACHIVTRSNLRLRYTTWNCVCLCSGHHSYFHRNPLDFIEFIATYYPEKLDFVQTHRYEITKMTPESYEKVIEAMT